MVSHLVLFLFQCLVKFYCLSWEVFDPPESLELVSLLEVYVLGVGNNCFE